MVDPNTFRQMALLFDEAAEQPHFEKTSFRVNQKIFATLDEHTNQAVLKLSETDQSVFCAFDKTVFYPVNGNWGKKGWTFVELPRVPKKMLQDALTLSYCNTAPKRLSKKYRQH
jgi:predicted DNA-binding protein (MmcQ/YjbR family)